VIDNLAMTVSKASATALLNPTPHGPTRPRPAPPRTSRLPSLAARGLLAAHRRADRSFSYKQS